MRLVLAETGLPSEMRHLAMKRGTSKGEGMGVHDKITDDWLVILTAT